MANSRSTNQDLHVVPPLHLDSLHPCGSAPHQASHTSNQSWVQVSLTAVECPNVLPEFVEVPISAANALTISSCAASRSTANWLSFCCNDAGNVPSDVDVPSEPIQDPVTIRKPQRFRIRSRVPQVPHILDFIYYIVYIYIRF